MVDFEFLNYSDHRLLSEASCFRCIEWREGEREIERAKERGEREEERRGSRTIHNQVVMWSSLCIIIYFLTNY